VNPILNVPIEVRLVVLGILGAFLGSVVNLAVYRLAWHRRRISPLSPPLDEAPARRPSDRIPILGWLGLRREAPLHGAGFWIRPLVVELVVALGAAALYWWEVDQLGLVRPWVAAPSAAVLHVTYVLHVLLLALMLIGSLIDVDEKLIPDAITVPGTLVGLLAAAVFPWAMLPAVAAAVGPGGAAAAPPVWDFLRLSSPNPWPDWLGGFPSRWSLGIALCCWWGWCFALTPRTWYARHGQVRALVLCCARLRRDTGTYRMAALGMLGSVGIALVWGFGVERWAGLLTSLVGMAAGGGIIWSVRIVGTAVLRREAMGFGDVTLMAMTGSFLGWQPCLVIFFLAPFAGLVIGLFSLILHRQSEIPYGPFLCLAAAFVVVRWAAVWQWAEAPFSLGLLVPAIVLVGLVLMAGLLGLWRAILG
jgi:leader peptidase (prepilin peptidase)/N-methyltransferase